MLAALGQEARGRQYGDRRRASVMAITAPSQYVSYPEVFHVDE